MSVTLHDLSVPRRHYFGKPISFGIYSSRSLSLALHSCMASRLKSSTLQQTTLSPNAPIV
eukprot:5800571-Amphidinium_carterae.1